MTEQDTTKTMPTEEPRPHKPRRLLRSRSDRMLGGVAGGLAKYFRVDPVIFRIGFAVTLFFGGTGFFAYLALAIFVPAEPKDPAQGDPPALTFGRIVLTSVMVVGGLIALAALALIAAWTAATGHGAMVAIVVILIGAALVVAAFRGGARWLVLPALALALPLGTVAAADIAFDGGIGEREHRPQTIAAIPAAGYELGVGQMKVDLRELSWKPNTIVSLETDQGVGQTLIAVPEDVCVTGIGEANVGAVDIAGDEVGGFDTQSEPNPGAKATPRLELDAHIDAGQIQLLNDDDEDLDAHDNRFGDDGLSRSELRSRMAAACAPQPEAGRSK